MKSVYQHITRQKAKNNKLFAVLIDPDKFIPDVVLTANKFKVDLFFAGGSTVNPADFKKTIRFIKKNSDIPLVIFPGDEKQIHPDADAILLLNLVSGRNPEYLIGKHVKAAFVLKKSKLEIIPTGYILLDNGTSSSATSKISGTKGISHTNKREVLSTALAAELTGNKLIYLEGGSGAEKEIPASLIKAVKKEISIPLITGGGIDSVTKAERAWNAGADVVVVGNAIEKNLILIKEISNLLKEKFRRGSV